MISKFITRETIEAIGEIARRRSLKDIIRIENDLHDMLKGYIKEAEHCAGYDFIVYTPERKIGKTFTLIKLACEYNIPLIVHDRLTVVKIKRDVKESTGKDIMVSTIDRMRYDLKHINTGIILKDEGVSLKDLRDNFFAIDYSISNVIGFN